MPCSQIYDSRRCMIHTSCKSRSIHLKIINKSTLVNKRSCSNTFKKTYFQTIEFSQTFLEGNNSSSSSSSSLKLRLAADITYKDTMLFFLLCIIIWCQYDFIKCLAYHFNKYRKISVLQNMRIKEKICKGKEQKRIRDYG